MIIPASNSLFTIVYSVLTLTSWFLWGNNVYAFTNYTQYLAWGYGPLYRILKSYDLAFWKEIMNTYNQTRPCLKHILFLHFFLVDCWQMQCVNSSLCR